MGVETCPQHDGCKLVRANTLSNCSVKNLYCGPLKVELPVVLADFCADINSEAEIVLPEPAIEIKRVLKELCITQCKVLKKTLFLGGYIRKNIEYATADKHTKTGVCGSIKHTTVNVPFECSLSIPFVYPPYKCHNYGSDDVEIIYKDKKMCLQNSSRQRSKDIALSNPLICDIYHANFTSEEIKECIIPLDECSTEGTFTRFIEKTLILINIRILQKLLFKAPSNPIPGHDKEYDKEPVKANVLSEKNKLSESGHLEE